MPSSRSNIFSHRCSITSLSPPGLIIFCSCSMPKNTLSAQWVMSCLSISGSRGVSRICTSVTVQDVEGAARVMSKENNNLEESVSNFIKSTNKNPPEWGWIYGRRLSSLKALSCRLVRSCIALRRIPTRDRTTISCRLCWGGICDEEKDWKCEDR